MSNCTDSFQKVFTGDLQKVSEIKRSGPIRDRSKTFLQRHQPHGQGHKGTGTGKADEPLFQLLKENTDILVHLFFLLLKKVDRLGGALLGALAAGNTLFGVNVGQIPVQGHSPLLTLLDADAAADTADRTDSSGIFAFIFVGTFNNNGIGAVM